MRTYVKMTARSHELCETLVAVDYAVEAHKGQNRKRSSVPYIYHTLNLACHALAMNITDDEIIAGCLLHDVIEDCKVKVGELPVSNSIKELVRVLTRDNNEDFNIKR